MKLFYQLFFFHHLSILYTSKASGNYRGENKKSRAFHNLILPVYIEGDSTWTIQERMKHYRCRGKHCCDTGSIRSNG